MVGMYRFPNGDAPSNRMLALAKTFQAAGYSPFVIANGAHEATWRQPSGPDRVDGIAFVTIRSQTNDVVRRALRRAFASFFLVSAMHKAGAKDAHSIYVTQGTLTAGIKFFARFVWRRPLIVDCMEWFEPGQFRLLRWSPEYMIFLYKFHLLCRGVNVIAISETLKAELQPRNREILVVPPQVDVSAFLPRASVQSSETLELFYAGSVGKKDYVGIAIQGLMLLTPEERSRIRFRLAGPMPEEVARLLPGGASALGTLGATCEFMGRVSRARVLETLSQSHFTVLLRPRSRYADAGFPSKIPESMAAGCVPMMNLTSDLAFYLRDGKDSLIVSDCSPEAFASCVRRALGLSVAARERMSRESQSAAASRLDFRVWVDSVGAFLRRLR